MLHGPQHVGAPVRPPQQGKETVVHALHAHGDAVDARGQIALHGPAGQQGFGVGLHADLGPGSQMEMPVDALQHGGLEIGRQQAGRTAAEKDALHRPPAQTRGPKVQLAQQVIPVGRHQGRGIGRGRAQRQGVEGAVAAAGAAEGDVDVNEHGGRGADADGWRYGAKSPGPRGGKAPHGLAKTTAQRIFCSLRWQSPPSPSRCAGRPFISMLRRKLWTSVFNASAPTSGRPRFS